MSLTGQPKYSRWVVEEETDHSPNINQQNRTDFFSPYEGFFLSFLRKLVLKMFKLTVGM